MAVEGLAIVVELVGKHSLRARGVEADIEATAASLLRQGSARLLQHCLTEGADCPFFDLESHRYHERRRLPYGAPVQLRVVRKGRGRLPRGPPALVSKNACHGFSSLRRQMRL